MTSAKPLPAPHRTLLVVLATIPSFDCLVNQLNNAFQISFGPLSLLQVLRGDVVVVFMVVTAWSLLRDRSGVRRIPLPAVAALLLIGMAITKEFVLTGALSMQVLAPTGR